MSLLNRLSLGLFAVVSLIALYFFARPHTSQEIALNTPLAPVHVRHHDELGLLQFTLPNGLRVCLKPTTFEDDEILFRMIAMGGYTALGPNGRASAELSTEVAWESGFDDLTSTEFSHLLDESSIDLLINVQALSHSIEAVCDSDEAELLLGLVNKVFKSQKFSQDAMFHVLNKSADGLKARAQDRTVCFEESVKRINSRNSSSIAPLTLEELRRFNYEDSKQFFYQSFSDPGQFVCIIVGNFDAERMQKLITHFLGFEQSSAPIASDTFLVPQFPSGITQANINLRHRQDSMARFTFPVEVELSPEKLCVMQVAIHTVEQSLRRAFENELGKTHGIDVSYDFPYFPYKNPIWWSIQFHTDRKALDRVETIVLGELQRLQNQGASLEEIQNVHQMQRRNNAYWVNSNAFWLSVLTHYLVWGWNPDVLLKPREFSEEDIQAVNRLIQENLNLTNYSLVIGTP